MDIMNTQMTIPGEIPEHLVFIPTGCKICYYLINHPQQGQCHYFQINANISGKHPDKTAMEYILRQYSTKPF